MHLKTLRKKIRKLETRLQEGPLKLVKMKRKLEAMTKAKARKAQKKLAAQFGGAEVISAVGCGHGIPIECPAVLEEAIFRMLDQLHKSGGRNRVY